MLFLAVRLCKGGEHASYYFVNEHEHEHKHKYAQTRTERRRGARQDFSVENSDDSN